MKAAFRPLLSWDGLLAALVVLALVYAVVTVPNFATSFNISQAIAGISEKALLVLPMALLMITREIDLSVASMLALTSVVLGALVQAGVPLPLAIAGALLVGAAAGLVNGLLVTRLGLSSLVVTLGSMALFRGLGYVILGPASVNVLPDTLTDFGINTLGPILPWTIVPFLLLAPAFVLILHFTPAGRRIYALGGNPDAALYSGVNGRRIRLTLFIVSGLVSAVAGIVFTARLSNARADNAIGFELDVITVALLGGINVFGGRGNYPGVFCALALIAILRDVLGLSQIGGDAQGIVIGLLLILSLLVSNVVQHVLAALLWRKTVRAQQREAVRPAR